MLDQIYELFGNLGYDVSLDGNVVTVLDSDTGKAWQVSVKTV